MSVHLITGYAGKEHIMASDQGSFNASFFGAGQFVMEAGSECEASIIDNNTVRVFDGDILMKGRHIRINPNTYEDCIIATGTADYNRYDLICMQYSKDLATGIESSEIVVIQGEEASGTPHDPEYVDGDILAGDTLNQMPLYRVKVSGVVLSEIECLFETIPTYETLAERYAEQFREACENYLGALGILDTMEEIEANTQPNQLAGALAVKEGFAKANAQFAKKSDVVCGKVGCTYVDAATLYALVEHNLGTNYIATATLDVSGIPYGELPDMQVWVSNLDNHIEIFVKGSGFAPSSGVYVQYIIHKA